MELLLCLDVSMSCGPNVVNDGGDFASSGTNTHLSHLDLRPSEVG